MADLDRDGLAGTEHILEPEVQEKKKKRKKVLLLLLLLLLPEARYVFLLFFPFLAELERAMLSLPLYYNMRMFRLPCSAGSHC